MRRIIPTIWFGTGIPSEGDCELKYFCNIIAYFVPNKVTH